MRPPDAQVGGLPCPATSQPMLHSATSTYQPLTGSIQRLWAPYQSDLRQCVVAENKTADGGRSPYGESNSPIRSAYLQARSSVSGVWNVTTLSWRQCNLPWPDPLSRALRRQTHECKDCYSSNEQHLTPVYLRSCRCVVCAGPM